MRALAAIYSFLHAVMIRMLGDLKKTVILVHNLGYAILILTVIRPLSLLWSARTSILVLATALSVAPLAFRSYSLLLNNSSALCHRCSFGLSDLYSRVRALEDVMQRHLYLDGTGSLDHASLAAGGRVIPELTSPTYTFNIRRPPWYKRWTRSSMSSSIPLPQPEYAITPHAHLGECWPMGGRNGTLGLALQRPVVITAFTIDHIPLRMTPSPETAPREGELWALVKDPALLLPLKASGLDVRRGSGLVGDLGSSRESPYRTSEFLRIGVFVFNVHDGRPFRTFDTFEAVHRMNIAFRELVLVVKDNWGSASYTCLYRVRVHSERDLGRRGQLSI